MWVANTKQMQELDRKAQTDHNLSILALMNSAGSAACEAAIERYNCSSVAILCGEGNNGGDGFAAAVHLHKKGVNVTVYSLFPIDKLNENAVHYYKECLEQKIDIIKIVNFNSFEFNTKPTLIIDAVFGTGMSGEDHPFSKLFANINKLNIPILSLDNPSGIDGTTGKQIGIAICASTTISFALPKRGYFLRDGLEHVGKLIHAEIGFPTEMLSHANTGVKILTPLEASSLLPKRKLNSNKGDNGKVLIIGGSRNMPGAPALAAISSLRIGAGSCTIAAPASIQTVIAQYHAECMTMSLPDNGTGFLTPAGIRSLADSLDKFNVFIVGPGLGSDLSIGEAMKMLFPIIKGPIVLDADGLNWLSKNPEMINKDHKVVMTPHPGEMSRLLRNQISDVENDRFAALDNCLSKWNQTVLLKGRFTLIGDHFNPIILNTTGNSGMASAGMGDTLTGIIAGLIGQGSSMYDAARLGAYIHGLAGDMAASKWGEIGYTSSDLSREISHAVHALREVV